MDLQASFDAAYGAHADAIFRYIYLKSGDRERALELMQEVFSAYWRRLCEGAVIDHPRAFLYRSAHNALVNELRDRRRPLSLETLAEGGFDIAYDAADAEALAVQREVIERLQRIEEPYRQTLLLRYVDGLMVRDIAEIMGEEQNTVSVRIKRGIEKLKKMYGAF